MNFNIRIMQVHYIKTIL